MKPKPGEPEPIGSIKLVALFHVDDRWAEVWEFDDRPGFDVYVWHEADTFKHTQAHGLYRAQALAVATEFVTGGEDLEDRARYPERERPQYPVPLGMVKRHRAVLHETDDSIELHGRFCLGWRDALADARRDGADAVRAPGAWRSFSTESRWFEA